MKYLGSKALTRAALARAALVHAVLAALLLTGCDGIPLGSPGPDVRKQQGPLTAPPPGLLTGTAR